MVAASVDELAGNPAFTIGTISAQGAKNKNLQFNFKSTSNNCICKGSGLSWRSL